MTAIPGAAFGVARDFAPPTSDRWAELRVRLCYLFRHQRLANLAEPRTFTELVQRRKLGNRDLRMVMLADKLAVKSFVAETIGQEWVTPTFWHGNELPAAPEWPLPFVLKSRHGSNQNIFFRGDADDWPSARAKSRHWLKRPYGEWLDEWIYGHIPRGLLAEPFVGEDGKLPVDYKIYTFGGRATHIQVHLDRENRHRWILLDRDWRRLSARTVDADPDQPQSLGRMLAAAEKLGCGFDFVRSDFYEVAGRPLFGEMTFYPGSGLDPFTPDSLDLWLGARWHAAQSRMRLPARPLDIAA